LQSYANTSVKQNYLVTSDSVTQKQIDEAQSLVDMLSKVRSDTDPGEANELLLEIYSIIPRRMSNVKYYIFGERSRLGLYNRPTLNRVIADEQATLDVMSGQVSTNAKTKNVQNKEKKTLLDAMGLAIEPIDDEDHATIMKLLGPNAHQFKSAVRVVNVSTQDRYDKFVLRAKNPQGYLFWHGSRNENWWSILDSGLLIRPSNAVFTGSMFGYGIYFADKAQKSIGYTSLRGSYWARGAGDKAYLALFAVHTGNWLHIKNHEYWMYELTEPKLKNRGPYDSLFAEGGADLRNNEYIVYNQAQCTVKYLIEIGI
jgi:poly [ADP-ribose] polymerase